MRLLSLLLALGLSACASDAPADTPEPAPAPVAAGPEADAPNGFDVQAWLAQARTMETAELDARRAHGNALAEGVDWKRACDTYVDPATGQETYDPIADEDGGIARGDFEVAEVGPGEAVVAVVCYFGAYQGSHALVWIDGPDARILSAPALDADGQPLAARERQFSTPDLSRFADGVVETFGKGRGMGDCGTLVRYAHDGRGALAVREVRQRECGDTIPDEIPPPGEWPVVFSSQ